MSTDESGSDGTVVTREFDTDTADLNVNVVSVVAELEGRSTAELPPLYQRIDHLLEHLFSDPPSPAADARVSFTYEGYRITVEQDGTATFEDLD